MFEFARRLILHNDLATETLRPFVRRVKRIRRKKASRLIIDAYLAANDVRKLQIGSGGKSLHGWLCTDAVPVAGEAFLDASETFPLPDRSFHYITGEHIIEHLTYEGGLMMLSECHRVLAPEGRIRITTPDLAVYIKMFGEPPSAEVQQFFERKFQACGWPRTASPACMILNRQVREWGHQFLYDRKTLRESFQLTGFGRIREFTPGQSDDPNLQGVDIRETLPNSRELNAYESMVMEAVRL